MPSAQALVRYRAAQRVAIDDEDEDEAQDGQRPAVPLFGGVFAIFGHGNAAGIGEALSCVGNATIIGVA